MTNAGYVFSPPAKTSWVVIHGMKLEYKKNKDFIRNFDPGLQTHIAKFLKNRRIKVNKTSDASMQALVNYCNTLINP
jgi:hypothetical protein